MFSPYYAWSGRKRPEDHAAMNVALYGAPSAWAMTERGAARLTRTADAITIGASGMRWDGANLLIRIDERQAPIPTPLAGRVLVKPEGLANRAFLIDRTGAHVWRPIAPIARVRVEMDSPRVAWSGLGYLDSNAGVEPIETGFRRWTWSRSHGEGTARVFYDAEPRGGAPLGLSLSFDRSGGSSAIEAPPGVSLGRGIWGVAREARIGAPATRIEPWEDAPFYTRTRVRTAQGEIVCETLDCDRVAHPIVRLMLPFRMPRIA